MLVGEGVAADGHFLFLLPEDISRAKRGIGKGRANRRTRGGTRTKRGLLAGGRWCLYNLCLDDAQNLPNLTADWGDDHGNLVEEVTSDACAGQV